MYKTLIFDLGRDAIRHLIRTYKIKQMEIPYYLCDVVRHTLVEENCKPSFYHIDDNFFPVKDFANDDFILYPNYWGVCGKNIKTLVDKYPKLIVDNAHAYYDKPSGFACFNAGHKFNSKESYLWIKDENANYMNTANLADNKNISIRIEKFIELHQKYKTTNLLDIDTDSIPYIYPYLAKTIQDADRLVKQLKKEGKTVYRFWNPLPKSFCEYKFYSRLVPIPILPY